MTEGWFEGIDPGEDAETEAAIRDGSAGEPADWPARAVEIGFATDAEDYYDRLHETATAAARAAVRDRERADDQQLTHAIRARDDCRRTANELRERLAEWAGSLGFDTEPAALADREPTDPAEKRVTDLARRVVDLESEADALERHVETVAPAVAPNLAALAGPTLAARLISLAGGLEPLAKKPSGTVQVLGAEEALFAHLRDGAPPPKHGVIYTHEYVRGTDPEHRGSAARALAGKLSIAARIDHYAGDRRGGLAEELDERIRRIRARGSA
ncbi:MAG: NOP5/NOP56 family protein [Salinirussus sp.]